MRVLMFGWEFPPHISGGLGTACYGLTRALARQNVDIIFVVPKLFGDEDQSALRLVSASEVTVDMEDSEYRKYWKRVKYLQINSTIIPYVSPEKSISEEDFKVLQEEFRRNVIYQQKYEFQGGYGANLYYEVARYALIAGAIASEEQFDCIHAHDWLTYPAGIAAKKVSGKPLIVHVHATEFDRSGEHVNQIVYDIERAGMEAADLVITVSNFTKNIVLTRYAIHPDKVITIHNGVDQQYEQKISAIKKKVPEKIVTFLGRITYQKGPEYFVETAKLLLQRDRNIRFVMAGSGDLLNKIIALVARYRISDRFHFTGFLKGEDVDMMFALSDVYVMPSVSEPFGISPLEAIRSNVPVVISKQSGVSEVLKHAIKVDYWDVEAMADAIYAILHYEPLARQFRSMAKAEVEHLRWDKAALKVKKAYQKVIQSKNKQ